MLFYVKWNGYKLSLTFLHLVLFYCLSWQICALSIFFRFDERKTSCRKLSPVSVETMVFFYYSHSFGHFIYSQFSLFHRRRWWAPWALLTFASSSAFFKAKNHSSTCIDPVTSSPWWEASCVAREVQYARSWQHLSSANRYMKYNLIHNRMEFSNLNKNIISVPAPPASCKIPDDVMVANAASVCLS